MPDKLLRLNEKMKRHPIEVECYSGGRDDERPRRVIIAGHTHVVVRLLATSVEETNVSRERIYRYRVLTEEGLLLEIVRAEDGRWYLLSEKRVEDG